MCIIMVKQLEQNFPSKEIFKAMWDNNPHYAGVAVSTKGRKKVEYKKGFTTFKDFYGYICSIKDVKNKCVVAHTRICTHGEICEELTHPFPISDDYSKMIKLEGEEEVVVFHNGVIHLNELPTDYKGSDTTFYIHNNLVKHYATDENFHLKEANRQLIKSEIKSKMAILTGDGHVEMIGDFNESDGIYYSNYSYVPYEPTVFTYRKKPTQIEEFVAYEKSEFEDLSTYGYNEESLFGNQLEYDEYTIMNGTKVYGDEAEIYLTDRGVYAFMDDTYEPYKIGDVAYDREDKEIKFIETPYTIFLW